MRSMLAVLLAGGAALAATDGSALAQAAKAYDYAPNVVDEPVLQAARPYGATYIPGVGFRYITPGGGPVVYGYYRAARGYRATRSAKRCRNDWWFGEGCRHWR